jgi:hypothetical protein
VLSFYVPPEWFVRVIYMFDRICPFPFFHQDVIAVLDDGYYMFDQSIAYSPLVDRSVVLYRSEFPILRAFGWSDGPSFCVFYYEPV